MIKVTICRADGSSSVTLIQPSKIDMIDQDNRPEKDRKGANAVVSMSDGKKLWVKETVEEISNQLNK